MFFLLIFLASMISCSVFPPNSYESCNFQSPPSVMDPIHQFPAHFNDTFLIIQLPNETDALCLDGTNYKFNYSRGIGSGQKKFLFYFLGGAFCGIDDGENALESCLSRASIYLGTSKYLPKNNTVMFASDPLGYLSSSAEYNPKFWNWHKIGINYCDGSHHQGYAKEPYIVNGSEIWFRGYNNTMGVFEWARKYWGLFDAEEILIGGESAGGQASFIWASYLQDYFPKHIKLAGFSDAGFFIDRYNLYAGCNLYGYKIMEHANITKPEQTDLLRRCSHKNGNETWKCLIPQYIVDDIEIPFFIINSQNDYEALLTHYYVFCVGYGTDSCNSFDKEQIHLLREEMLEQIFYIKKTKPNWGFWLRTCIEHIYWKNYAWYTEEMKVYNAEIHKAVDLKSAFHDWYFSLDANYTKSHSYIDLISFEFACPGNFYKVKDPAEEEKQVNEDKSE